MNQLRSELEKNRDRIKIEKAVLGFDGYIDELLYLVQNRINQDEFEPFTTISDFGYFLLNNKSSCGFEMKSITKKIGGNGPIFANVLAELGLQTKCIGTFGTSKIEDIFLESKVSEWISIGEVAHTLAFEFQDGKLMFGEQDGLNRLTWNSILQNVGLKRLVECFNESSIIGITNWSQMVNSNNLWRGILENCMPHLDTNKKRYLFFDLADPANRSMEELYEGLKLIEAYQKYGENVLGLNKREAEIVYKCLYGQATPIHDFEYIGNKIVEKLDISILVLHSSDVVTAFQENKIYSVLCNKITDPKLLTGCGDNFNAGFCLGLLLDLPMTSCIQLGSSVAAYYITNAYSPKFDELIEFTMKGEE